MIVLIPSIHVAHFSCCSGPTYIVAENYNYSSPIPHQATQALWQNDGLTSWIGILRKAWIRLEWHSLCFKLKTWSYQRQKHLYSSSISHTFTVSRECCCCPMNFNIVSRFQLNNGIYVVQTVDGACQTLQVSQLYWQNQSM